MERRMVMPNTNKERKWSKLGHLVWTPFMDVYWPRMSVNVSHNYLHLAYFAYYYFSKSGTWYNNYLEAISKLFIYRFIST